MHAMKNYLIAAIFALTGSFAVAQNNLPATPNPSNLAEAAGLYAGATVLTKTVKSSSCGFAVSREAPPLSVVARNDIVPQFPRDRQEEVYQALLKLEPDMIRQGSATFSHLYNHYTKNEGLDHRTACGFVASAAISTQKLAKEAMTRMAVR